MMQRAFRRFRLALSFLTIVPVPFGEEEVDEADLAGWLAFAPSIGLLIGLVLAGISHILSQVALSVEAASFLLLAFWAAITGGLHLDGLADTADGLFLRGGPGRRLEVMRDPHLGSFGAIALTLLLLGKYAALGHLDSRGRALALLGAPIVGRALILVAAGTAGYARPEGVGRAVVTGTRPIMALGGIALVIGGGWLTRGQVGAIGGTVALLTIGLLTWTARERLGGITGDILGASVELGELAYLLVVGGMVRP